MARRKGPVEREKRLNVNMSDAELALAHALASAEGVDVSTYVRQLFYREGRARGLWPPPTKKKGAKP